MIRVAMFALARFGVPVDETPQFSGVFAQTSSKNFFWNGVPISDGELTQLKPDPDGTLHVPVFKDGKVDPFWILDSNSAFEQVEAGKASGLRVTAAESATPILISKSNEKSILVSKKFQITPDVKMLNGLRIIGNGDMSGTYISLKISFGGGPVLNWARQAPSSVTTFQPFKVDLAKIHDHAAGKDIVAQLEIVQTGANKVIGVVVRQNLTATNDSIRLRLLPKLSALDVLRNITEKSEMFNKSSTNLSYDKERDAIKPSENVSYTDFLVIRNEVNRQIFSRLNFYSGESLDDLGKRIKLIVDAIMFSIFDGKYYSDEKLTEWMYAEAVTAQMLKVQYDHQVAAQNPGVTNSYTSGQVLLDMKYPKSICSGIALLTRDVARSIGVKCYYVGGFTREIGAQLGKNSNHAWVVFEFLSGLMVPADTTIASFGRDKIGIDFKNVKEKIFPETLLPTTRAEWSYFLSLYFAKDESSYRYGDEQSIRTLSNMRFDQFCSIDTRHLSVLNRAFADINRQVIFSR